MRGRCGRDTLLRLRGGYRIATTACEPIGTPRLVNPIRADRGIGIVTAAKRGCGGRAAALTGVAFQPMPVGAMARGAMIRWPRRSKGGLVVRQGTQLALVRRAAATATATRGQEQDAAKDNCGCQSTFHHLRDPPGCANMPITNRRPFTLKNLVALWSQPPRGGRGRSTRPPGLG